MTIALIAHSIGQSAGGNNTVTSGSGTTTNADFIGAIGAHGGSTGGEGFTDSKGNTYSLRTVYNGGGGQTVIGYAWGPPTVGSGHTVTFSNSGNFSAIAWAAFSGLLTSGDPYDVENGLSASGSSTTIAPGSVTPGQNGSLILTGATGFTDPNSINASLTITDHAALFSIGTGVGIGLAWYEQPTAGAISPTWTYSGSDASRAAAIAAFKPAAGGGGNVVSGGATEGPDATSGNVRVAVKASGGATETADATAGNIKVAAKVSGGATEGADVSAGSVKLAAKISGGTTEGADATAGSVSTAPHVSGNINEGADATAGTVKIALKVSGGTTEGADVTSGNVKLASKVSGGTTEGADFTAGNISIGSSHVSGAIVEGTDATTGTVKVALKVSGDATEGADQCAGNIKLAVKVSGGITEGPDATAGTIVTTSRTITGNIGEGADSTQGAIRGVAVGGHFLPLTKKELAAARKKAKAAREREEAGWDQAAKDKAELHQQIMATLHPEKILGPGKPIETVEEDDDEADIEMLLLYG